MKYILVQIVESVGDAYYHLHTRLIGQLPNGCISFLPKRLGVILVGQASNVPLLRELQCHTVRGRK